MIFVDSNIPMYLMGTDLHFKQITESTLKRLVIKEVLVTNTEVLQEILHRFVSMNRREAIQPTLDVLYHFIDKIYPVEEIDVLAAKDLLHGYRQLSARDAIHISHMQRLKIETIFSFDQGFDQVPWIKKIST